MAADPIVEAIDVVGDIVQGELSVFVELLLDAFLPFFKLPKNDSATALSQQLPFRLMVGSR